MWPPLSVQMAIAVALVCRLDLLLAVGLLYVASVPGGGLGYVATSAISGQRALSAASNCLSTLLALGKRDVFFDMHTLRCTYIHGHTHAHTHIRTRRRI